MDPAILIIILFVVAPLLERLLKAGKGDQKTPPGQRPPPRPGQVPGQWPPPTGQRRIPEQQPGTGVPGARTEPAQTRQAGGRAEEESAAAMLPDDLWEILTGERRMPPPTRPPADDEYEPEFDDEIHDVIEDEITSDELGQESEPAADAESWRRAGPVPWEPEPPAPRAPPTARPPARPLPAPVEARNVPTRRPAERAVHVREIPDYGAPQVVSLEQLTFDDDERHDRFHERLEGLPPAARGRRKARPFAAEQFTDDDLRRAFIMAEVLGTPRGLE